MAVVKLRGHHVPGLLDYFRWKKQQPVYDVILETNRFGGYGQKFMDHKRELYDLLYTHPDQNIVIVENCLDDLCKGECLALTAECRKRSEFDAVVAKQFHFPVRRRPYRAKDFLTYLSNRNWQF